MGAEVGGVDLAQRAAALAHGCADGVDDVGLSHGGAPLCWIVKFCRSRCGPLGACSGLTITDEPWPNRPWLTVMPDGGAVDLAAGGLAPELPGELAHLGDGLGGDRLAEAGQPAARVDRHPPAERRVAVVEEALGLALLAQPEVLVPVELEGRRQVVDLGHVDVVGPEARLLVGGGADGVAEGPGGRGRHGCTSRWRSSASR